LPSRKMAQSLQWGQSNASPPAGMTNVARIASGTNFHLAILSKLDSRSLGSQRLRPDQCAGRSQQCGFHRGGRRACACSKAKRVRGRVGSKRFRGDERTANLTNAMADCRWLCAQHCLIERGTPIMWGNNGYGQTNAQALGPVKLIAAGGYHNLAARSCPIRSIPGRSSEGSAVNLQHQLIGELERMRLLPPEPSFG